MGTHKDLKSWQLAMDLVEEVYKNTAKFPKEEQYGLISQMRRCVVSVPSNIAEGAARNTTKEYIHFLYISLGSLSELETQIEICRRLDYYGSENIIEMIEKIRRMLLNLVKYLKEPTHFENSETLKRSNTLTH
jgi:four helix bundle protein